MSKSTLSKSIIGKPTVTDANVFLQIGSTSTTEKTLVLQKIASQSASVFEVQDEAGSPLTKILSDGTLQFTTAPNALRGAGMIKIVPQGGNLVSGIIMERPSSAWGGTATGGSAGYAEGQFLAFFQEHVGGDDNNLDAVLYRVDKYGGVGQNGGLHLAFGLTETPPGATQVLLIQPSVDIVHEALAGNAGKTTDYRIVQNSSAAVLNRLNASGQNIQAIGSASLPAYTFVGDETTGLFSTSGTVKVTTGGVERASFGSSGLTVSSGGVSITGSTFGYSLFAQPPAAAGIGFIVRGHASQSGNLIECQNNAGDILARVKSNGLIGTAFVTEPTDVGPYLWNLTTAQAIMDRGSQGTGACFGVYGGASRTALVMSVTSGHASAVPLALVAAASQTGDLFQAKASDGTTVLARVTSAGVVKEGIVPLTKKVPVVMSKNGVLTVAAGTHRFYVEDSWTIIAVRASVGTAPTGASILVDVNKNGTTIFTTQSNRPTIAASGFTDLADAVEVTSLTAGDYLTVDVDQIGSTIAGSDLTVTIWLQRA